MSKYKPGEFGYFWCNALGRPDIDGKIYNGDVTCSYNKITSLKGAPKVVNGNFDCYNNKLTSLEYSPEKVNGTYFDCAKNMIESLEFAPKIIKGHFWCNHNKIKDINEFKKIKYCKEIYSDLDNDKAINLIKARNSEYYC